MTETILIVDDSSFIVEGLVAILKKSYRPLTAYSGPQCLDLLQNEKPAIIILDIMMEPMDGWETLARIKENPATQHIPVLMFSAKKISAEEAEEHRIGIDDFVSKPVTTKKLIESIEKVLSRQKANRASIVSWRSAGIGQDRIDEYTSLITNLEVDMSLLQNMKVQLSLVHDDDNKSRTDLEDVIAAIENRIQEERLHEEQLSSEMHESVAKNADVKEDSGPVPAMNESGPESLPVVRERTTAAQREFPDSYHNFKDKINSSAPEIFHTDVNESHEIVVTDISTIHDVCLPDSTLPDTTIIPDTYNSDFLFESEICEKIPLNNPVSETLPESHSNHPAPVLYGVSSSLEITNPATRPLSPETSTGKFSIGVKVSSDRKAPVAEQKSPVRPVPIPLSVKTPDKKPVAQKVPPLGVVGSGTDIPLRLNLSNSGKIREPKIDNPFMPVEEVALPSGGFFSKIISMIIGIFKRH